LYRKRFEVEKLGKFPHLVYARASFEQGVSSAAQDVEMEDLNFYYANYSRIYNDVITLRKGSSYM
jgi:uncharacterized Rmd1/YagE family protein